MPLYTFKCQRCETIQVVDHGINEPHPKYCAEFIYVDVHPANDKLLKRREVCAGKLQRVFDAPNITFHGSGFYRTDKWQYEPTQDQIDDAEV